MHDKYFINSIFSSIILICYRVIFSKLSFNKKLVNVGPWITGIYEFIIIGFISLLLNFFFQINKLIGAIFLSFHYIEIAYVKPSINAILRNLNFRLLFIF